MRRVALLTLFIFFPAFVHAAVVINEVAWMGTTVSASAEWMELANTGNTTIDLTGWVLSIEGKKDISLSGNINTGGFYLIERTDDTPVPTVSANLIASFGTGLANTGAKLSLKDANNSSVDTVDGSDAWKINGVVAGNNTTKETAQRTATGWETATSTPGAANANVSDTPADTSDSDSTPADTSSDTNSTTVTTTSSSSGGSSTTKATYIPPPSALTVDAGGNQSATMEVPLHFSARATIKSGATDSSAQIVWGFGDGSGAEGTAVEKTYNYAGTYLVVVTATDGVATGRDEFTVTVRPGQVHILGIRGTGVMIANDASERLDLSGWALFADTHSFRIPNGTILLPKTSVLFSSAITKLVIEQEVTLAYPDGDIASQYVSSPEPVTTSTTVNAVPQSEQPSSAPVSYKEVPTVEDIISPKTPVESYENKAVIAPAVTPDTGVTAGAIVPAPIVPPPLAAVATAPETAKTPATGLFHSVWSLGLLGIMALAGGAFILL